MFYAFPAPRISIGPWSNDGRWSWLRRLRPRPLSAPAHGHLALARKIDRLAENPRRLLRRVEAGRVLRLDEIEAGSMPRLIEDSIYDY